MIRLINPTYIATATLSPVLKQMNKKKKSNIILKTFLAGNHKAKNFYISKFTLSRGYLQKCFVYGIIMDHPWCHNLYWTYIELSYYLLWSIYFLHQTGLAMSRLRWLHVGIRANARLKNKFVDVLFQELKTMVVANNANWTIGGHYLILVRSVVKSRFDTSWWACGE